MTAKKRIVAEINRNWIGDKSDDDKPLVSQEFEKMIAHNAEFGYELKSWQYRQYTDPRVQGLSETIIAVFVLQV